MGHSVVAKVVDSQYRYDTNTDLADTNLGIGDPMQSLVNSHLRIESLDIDLRK